MSETSFIAGDYPMWVYAVAGVGSVAFPPLGAFLVGWVAWDALAGGDADPAEGDAVPAE
jgi:hypothetical protein